MMVAEEIKIECEENGFHLVVDGETWLIADPEALYDHVKAMIGPWLRERDDAQRAYQAHVGAFHCDPDESGGYDIGDPKHPDWHSVHADIWDARAGK